MGALIQPRLSKYSPQCVFILGFFFKVAFLISQLDIGSMEEEPVDVKQMKFQIEYKNLNMRLIAHESS